jgi:hypothetical protein
MYQSTPPRPLVSNGTPLNSKRRTAASIDILVREVSRFKDTREIADTQLSGMPARVQCGQKAREPKKTSKTTSKKTRESVFENLVVFFFLSACPSKWMTTAPKYMVTQDVKEN